MAEDASSRVVFIVDDDPSFRGAIQHLLSARGYRVEAFATAEEFYARPEAEDESCLLLDLHLPGMDGLELLDVLRTRQRRVPIVVLTAKGDVPTAVRAIKAGATDFLVKPVDGRMLTRTLDACFRAGSMHRDERRGRAELQRRYSSLTPREREAFSHITAGKRNKHVAREMGITERTVKAHRARVLSKMRARSLAELVRMAVALGLPRGDDTARRTE